MYSNDTRELERQLQKLKENKEFNDIFNSIETYLNTPNIKKSLEIIYELIKDNYCHIFQNVDITADSKLNNKKRETLNTKLDNIIFLSKNDRKNIKKTMPLISEINATYKTNNIKLYIVSKEDEQLEKDVIRRIVSKLFMLIDLFTNAQKTTYNLYVWLSDLKKYKPNSKKTFRSQHINSGATVHNLLEETVELFIWRKEEIEKVLLHEMIHTLKLDFMGYPDELKQAIIQTFNIPSSIDLRLGEAYVETWAILLNTMYISFTSKTQCESKSNGFFKFFKLFTMEICFTLYKSSKILSHFGYGCITGCEVPLIKSKNPNDATHELFEQETSVFSYYLIKGSVLMNLDGFINFCCKNNELLLQFVESPENYQELHRVFIESAKKNILLNKMTNLNINLDENEQENELLDNTMRMTLYELKL